LPQRILAEVAAEAGLIVSRSLHRLTKATSISWPALHAQFGTGYKAVRQFKPRFTEALEAALAAYPEARVDLGDKAITLNPARPPIAWIA
jgi:hypothetical protein